MLYLQPTCLNLWLSNALFQIALENIIASKIIKVYVKSEALKFSKIQNIFLNFIVTHLFLFMLML